MTDTERGKITIERDADGKGNTKVSLQVDGESASWAWIIPMTIRVGVATVRMDGIGGVETLERRRNRGYSRRVLTAALDHMVAGDAPLTTLYGIPHYYPRWGYATIGAEGGIRLTRLDAADVLPVGHRVREANPADLPAIRTLYDAATRTAVAALVRSADTGAWQVLLTSLESDKGECRVVVNDAGDVVAYAWVASGNWWIQARQRDDPKGWQIGEAFASTPDAADALLMACRQWAGEMDREHVDLHQPALGPIGLAARLQDSTSLSRSFREGQFMGRSTGVADLMRSLEPELQHRWSQSSCDWTGSILVRTGEDEVVIQLAPRSLTVIGETGLKAPVVVDLMPGDVARLALGSFPPVDLLDRIGIARDVSELLAILFPEQRPYIYPADRF
ncbi:MAG: GNAT family N-acetyltransferase [Thermomicrobiales bacterium]